MFRAVALATLVNTTLATMLCLGQAPPAGRQLTARELFYAAAEQPAAKAAPVKAPSRTAGSKPARRAPQPKDNAGAAPPAQPPRQVVAHTPVDHPAEGRLVPVAFTGGAPLGLRYTLLKLVDGRMVEVSPDSAFHAGDRIQVAVEANDAGYLYIVHQGSSGTWKPLFPSAEIEEGNNRIEKGRVYVMPPKSRFYFDEQAGEEKLFVVFSRQPEPDLEQLVYALRGGQQVPTSEPARPRREPLMMASLQIQDSVVGNLRKVYARDLVIEKVDDEAEPPKNAPGRKEKAVYVVNPTGSPDSRVVADIRLTHR
ncbi:MAG TPA: DUF4384 domain-containing protein [Bryobacteraceae bacterium]|nr:DUF4384 domain-containing protein [Bryobacteraceae bacterium]